MESKEWKFVDKSKWHDGPWQDEPDKMQWRDEKTGLPCLIHRGGSGSLCGYVGVSEGHPYYGKKYSQLDTRIDIHGGLTYSDFCQEVNESTGRGVCHVVHPEEKVSWFGFDCAHLGDVSPGYGDAFFFDPASSYKEIPYVKREVVGLAAQLAELKGGES